MMKWILLITLVFIVGCNRSVIKVPVPGDGVTELTGKAADDYAQVLVQNTKTASGRVNETFDSLKKLVPFLFVVLLAGGVFAFWTRSKYAALIPVTAAIGIALIFFIGAWVEYIKWAMLGIVIAVILWRAIIYQKERNLAAQNELKMKAALKNNINCP